MELWLAIVLIISGIVISAIAFFFVGISYRKKVAEKLKLFLCGQSTEKQQPDRFFKSVPVFIQAGVHNIVDVDPAV